MASSSIEVMGMGGGDVKVMLMQDSVVGDEDEDLHTMIAAAGEDEDEEMMASVQQDEDEEEEEGAEQGFDMDDEEDEEQFTKGDIEAPPGTIIFSPQDLMQPSKPTNRGRARSIIRPKFAAYKRVPAMPPMYSNSGDVEIPVACEICGKMMMTGKTLVQHMAIHSDMKPFQCPHCPKSFARKVHLQGHLVAHGIEKQFECPICHQRFSRQDCVKVHMRLHDKSKCVYCDVCHKAFLTVGALNIHLRIHRGEKPFKCHLCSKCFTQKNHLITHIKRHTKVTDEHFTKKLGPRMFKCEHCPRAFIRLSDYERHVQWNHGAVAENGIVDKLPTVQNLVEGELKQTGLAPQIFKAPKDALNSRPRTRRPRKIMCTTSTQTDDDGGKIIVPRKYQVSAGTQVSAPPTPRREEDMYENDIFDEGMDRNYSSDEDEDSPQRINSSSDPLEEKVFGAPMTAEMASDPIQDAAFDAIVQGNAPKQTEPSRTSEDKTRDKQDSQFLDNVVSTLAKHSLIPTPSDKTDKPTPDSPSEDQDADQLPEIRMVPGVGQPVKQVNTKVEVIVGTPYQITRPMPPPKKLPVGVLPITLRNPPKRMRGRGTRKFRPYGLSGAAGLMAIRLNLMKNIMNVDQEEQQPMKEIEQVNIDEQTGDMTAGEDGQEGRVVIINTPVEEVDSESFIIETEGARVETEGRAKRLTKNKQHGKDFVCNMKTCDICCPQSRTNRPTTTTAAAGPTKIVSKIKSESPKKLTAAQRTEGGDAAANSRTDSAQGLLSLSQAAMMKRVKMEQYDEPKTKVGNHVTTYPVDITANPVVSKAPVTTSSETAGGDPNYFVTSTTGASIVSPPVELASFCIPTYSCKLCSREFRFEGKLHRHIESVHQNKAIFSPDVKPGRGSTRFITRQELKGTIKGTIISAESLSLSLSKSESENPEIAALRSDWDDEDGDGEDSNPSERTVSPEFPLHPPVPIVTRDIAPVTTTVTGSYTSGVKVNMNKLAGLLPQMSKEGASREQESRKADLTSAPSVPREPETIMADTLDMKCRRLLEKLFDHDLLLQCGLLEEHVSVVLGKVLQHYGVKMIEDYGQGEYEVLKYNLWRLIEWKVTMEQMEEFYTEGKSVEEMMDDIMHERVPVVSHHFVPREQAAVTTTTHTTATTNPSQTQAQAPTTQVQTVDMGDGQVMLQHVAGVLGGQITLSEGVTQVVLSQDVSPELLQGAHIVTIDPTTGQVLSQVTADQVILTDAIGDELEQQVSALDGPVVVSQSQLSQMGHGTIVASHSSGMPLQTTQVLMQEAGPSHHIITTPTTQHH